MHADQCYRLHVADDAIVLNRLKAHTVADMLRDSTSPIRKDRRGFYGGLTRRHLV